MREAVAPVGDVEVPADPAAGDSSLVALRGVGKEYALRTSGTRKLAAVASILRGRPLPQASTFKALQDISFDVRRGESTGLVGVNGAGKSTLLKLIAGVVRPSSGSLQVRGRVGALLELGAGFHPEYTGRENINLACALLGLSPRETRQRIGDIIAFADIGAHIEQPVKHYSSGMVVRLGFAVATSVVPDVLITDEVLAVGDESFQRKCIAWMESYLSRGGTLLLCSHSMYHIQKLCSRALWIHDGRLHRNGNSADVTREYLAWHEERLAPATNAVKPVEAAPVAATQYEIRSMRLNDLDQHDPVTLPQDGVLTFSGTVYSPDGRPPGISVAVVRVDGTPVYGTFSELRAYRPKAVGPNLFAYAVRFPALPLLPGRYVARSHAMDPEGMRLFDQVERKFDVVGHSREMGLCRMEHEWLTPET
jgi:lipopolysaccharide transport system ATP-binding protein